MTTHEVDIELGPSDVAGLGDPVLLDVREDDEWAAGRMPGAVHVRLGDLHPEHPVLAHDRPILCICRSGNRSRQATRALRHIGFDARNLDGGMKAWEAAGFPVVNGRGDRGIVI
jgi:rhodanese-related sulfurtransferase